MADTFALDIAKFVAKANLAPKIVVQKSVGRLFHDVVKATPVGNSDKWKVKRAPPGYVGGRLRANWNPSLVAPDFSTSSAVDASGARTDARITSTLTAWDGQVIYLMNSLPYARPVEYGHSQAQAPQGMVRINVTAWQKHINDAVRSIK